MSIYTIFGALSPIAEFLGLAMLGGGLYHNDLSSARIGISIFATANFLESMYYSTEVVSLNKRLVKTEQLYEKLKEEKSK